MNCYPTDNAIILTRAMKSLLPHISHLIGPRSAPPADTDGDKKGKKRKTYEGEELFHTGSHVVIGTTEQGDAVLLALDCMRLLLRNPTLPVHLQSLAGRLVLSLAMELPGVQPALLSVDESLHARLLDKVAEVCAEVVSSRATMGRSVGVVVRTVRALSVPSLGGLLTRAGLDE